MTKKSEGTETVAKQGTNKEWGELKSISVLTGGASKDLRRGSPIKHMPIRVNTFHREAQEPYSKKTTTHDDKAADPFLYFSSDKRRLEYLLGKEPPHMPSEDKPTERKTRISFELDPFFDLVTSFPELLGDEAIGDESFTGSMNDI